ncbi:LysR family transcriptional regulator [Rhizobium tubonense]|uniref:HTH-type transcriptional regulator TtuA n=1 Tax=Rhizobium tubonense TaxID=484088 RepID=A0A2W4E4D1_9HYPH|nr:LysR family transcriptional regulator [Rhizobium tubonense]PZM10466.1 LysR family transcriptional regulator [Rhizobium tubonense]
MAVSMNDIPVFMCAVETGGFSEAGRKLNLSRSSVGRAVSRLEIGLKVRLFDRTTRHQNVTAEGQLFYEHCQRAMAELRSVEAALDSGLSVPRGKLRVSMPALFGRMCVAPILTQLARDNVDLELELNFSDRKVDLLEDGYDLAIRNGSPGNGAGMRVRRVGYEETMIYAAPAYLEKRGIPVTALDLTDHDTVTYSRGGRVQSWMLEHEGAIREFTPVSRFRLDDIDAIADAAASGLGLSWLPSWLVRKRVDAGELVGVMREMPPYVSKVWAVWPDGTHLPTRVRAAIDEIALKLPNPGSSIAV